MSESESTSGRVLELAEEFLERYRKGERPSLREYINRHPELATEIKEVFPAMAMMERIAIGNDSAPSKTQKSTSKAREDQGLQQLGDYRVIREIGRGGMGIVYEAEQLSLGRHVALKVLPQKALANERTRKRFEREAKSAAKLHHTNIVPVFGTGEHNGTPFYVMQFIQGTGLDIVIKELARLTPGAAPQADPTASAATPAAPRPDISVIAQSLLTGAYRPGELSEPARTGEPEETPPRRNAVPVSTAVASASSERLSGSSAVSLPGQSNSSSGSRLRKLTYWQSVARVGVQVADALEYAHKQGVVHRDIKPSNLLLDMAGTVWVTDFGLAKSDDQENLTHTGDLLGTFRYMPPEAFEGQGDARGDVYSLGLTLYELAALRPAFDEQDRNKMIKQVTTSEPAPVGRVRPGVPRDLETIIHKAIEREPARRYPRAEALAEDLRRFLEDRPVRARRASGVERLVRWGRRNPQVAASVAGIVAIFLAAFALVSWSYWRAEDAFRNEATQRHQAQAREKSERWERYRANLIGAGSALQLHNVTAAKSALDAAPEEHRNWEWRYLYQQFDTAQHVVRLGADLLSLGISPDGTLAAVQPASGPARLWNLGTRQEIGALRNQAPATAFWFSRDNKILGCEVGDKIVLWDVAANRERAVLAFPGKRVSEHQFSPNGERLVGCAGDRAALVWDTATGQQLLTLQGHEQPVNNAVFSPDGRRIATSGNLDRTARLWDAQTGKALALLAPHEGPAGQVIFNPQGDRVLVIESYPSNALRLWDPATGKLLKVMRGHTNGAEKVSFSPDGARIASSGLDRTIRLWDGRTGEALASRDGHRGAVTSVAFSPDGKHLVSASHDQTVRLWDATTAAPLGVLHGHTGAIFDASARYTADGRTIVTASVADGTIRLWDARRAEWNDSLRGHGDFVYSVAFHPDGERVASAAWDGTIRIWEATTGRQLSVMNHPSAGPFDKRIQSSVAFHPAGKLVASFARDGAVRFWELTTAQEAFRFQLPQDNVYSSDPRVALSSRGNLLAAPGGNGNTVHVWDVERRAEVAVLRGHTSYVLETCFSPNDSWLATAGHDRTVRIWDLATYQEIQVLEGHIDAVLAVAVSRDGKWLASGSGDGTVRIWDTTTWRKIDDLKHGTMIYGMAFSPDGTRLACACANNLIRFWDMATLQLVAELDGHGAYVHQVAFSPDGTRLVSGSGDFTVRVWDSLTVQERARAQAKEK